VSLARATQASAAQSVGGPKPGTEGCGPQSRRPQGDRVVRLSWTRTFRVSCFAATRGWSSAQNRIGDRRPCDVAR